MCFDVLEMLHRRRVLLRNVAPGNIILRRADGAPVLLEIFSARTINGHVDKQTMRQFDASCLTPVEDLAPADIVVMREKAGVSRAIFACALNVTADYISKIERGAKRPTGSTLKLLSLGRRKGFEGLAQSKNMP